MQPMTKITNMPSVSMEVLFLVTHYAAVVEICQDIVDKSSSWNSESTSQATSLQLARLLHHSPCFPPSSPCLDVFQVTLDCIFPSYFRSSSLPFPWYIRPKHFPQCVFFISPRHMPLPVRHSLNDLLRSLHHSRCPSSVSVPDLVFACHSVHPP